jgi:hypothetical protein
MSISHPSMEVLMNRLKDLPYMNRR